MWSEVWRIGWFNVPFDIAQLRGAGIMSMEIDDVVTKRVGVVEDGWYKTLVAAEGLYILPFALFANERCARETF